MLNIGETLFDPSARRLLRGQKEAKLSPKATAVLIALAETPGQVWSRDALLERVWPRVHVGEEVLSHTIAELRRAFGDDFRNPRYIGTVHKSGYRLLTPVLRDDPAAIFAGVSAGAGRSAPSSFSLRSYALYISACELYEKGGRSNTREALAQFSEAVGISRDFALAHAGLAKAAAFLNTFYEAEPGLLSRALQHCETAHRLTSGSADAFAAEGFIYGVSGQKERSLESFSAAISIKPDSAETHYLMGRAGVLNLDLRFCAVMFERAAKLHGTHYHYPYVAGKVRLAAGDEQRARTNYSLALARIQNLRRVERADSRAQCCEARCLWHLNRRDEALSLVGSVARQADRVNYHLAATLALSEHCDEAVDLLSQIVELGWKHKAWLDRDPDLDSLRDHPRFKRIVASLH